MPAGTRCTCSFAAIFGLTNSQLVRPDDSQERFETATVFTVSKTSHNSRTINPFPGVPDFFSGYGTLSGEFLDQKL